MIIRSGPNGPFSLVGRFISVGRETHVPLQKFHRRGLDPLLSNKIKPPARLKRLTSGSLGHLVIHDPCVDHLVRLPPRNLLLHLASLSVSILKRGLIKCAFCCESAFFWPGIGSCVRGLHVSVQGRLNVLPRVAGEPSAFEEASGIRNTATWGYPFVIVLNSATDSVYILCNRNSDCKQALGSTVRQSVLTTSKDNHA